MNEKIIIKYFKFFLFINSWFLLIYIFLNKNLYIKNNYYLSNLFLNINKTDDINGIFFQLDNLIYSFSYKYNVIEIKYSITFYNKTKNIVKPSDLTLFNKIFITCHMEKNNNNSNSIDSLANIFKNHYFCIQYFHFNEKIKAGIKIYHHKIEKTKIYFFDDNSIHYRKLYQNNTKFDSMIMENEYFQNKKNKSLKKQNYFGLKQFYIDKPYNISNIQNDFDNNWKFKNIYNNYFCLCKGKCHYRYLPKLCKYNFYLYIIDNNKNEFNKTEFLLSDFFSVTSDDTFPLFKEMIKLNINAHYIDNKKNIYNEICKNEKNCLKVISIKNNIVDGDFLEKYLDIILKLKAIIAGHELKSIYNIFYYIDYINYINLGHGIKYFKHFLYSNYSSYKKYNKLVLPPSQKIISLAKKYGWKDENIIKNCLPKWDKYNINQYKISNKNENNSIFIMFTWRNLLNESLSISPLYLNNIIQLINDEELSNVLEKNKITLFFSFHPNFQKYNKNIKYNKYIKYIKIKDISECLMKASLLISDFSSIIFDMIYQRKPFIIFIPDAY